MESLWETGLTNDKRYLGDSTSVKKTLRWKLICMPNSTLTLEHDFYSGIISSDNNIGC